MLNESIVATGIHYLASENITSSDLDFRMGLDPDDAQRLPYEQVMQVVLRRQVQD